MKTTTNNNANEVFNEMMSKIVFSPFFRLVLMAGALVTIYHHLHFFYESVWHQKGVATLWSLAHLGISIFLLLKKDAFNDFLSSGYITIFLLALTYIFHCNLFGLNPNHNLIIMRTLIIVITLGGVYSIAHTFNKSL